MSSPVISWLPTGVKHWRVESVRWVCIPLDSDDTIAAVVLEDGDHHYFDEWHVFDRNGMHLYEQTLLGPRPICIWCNEDRSSTLPGKRPEYESVVVENLSGKILLARARFLPYSNRPFEATGQSNEVSCGQLLRAEGAQPVFMHIFASLEGVRHIEEIEDVQDVVADFLVRHSPLPRIELRAGNHHIPFELVYPLPQTTEVFLLTDQAVHSSIAPGREISLTHLEGVIPSLSIKAGAQTPGVTSLPVEWNVALPVLIRGRGLGLVGAPLASSKLIANLELHRTGAEIWASWEWIAPKLWLEVRLSWDRINRDGWVGERRERKIARQTNARTAAVKIMDVRSEHIPSDLDLVVIPIILHTERRDLQLRCKQKIR